MRDTAKVTRPSRFGAITVLVEATHRRSFAVSNYIGPRCQCTISNRVVYYTAWCIIVKISIYIAVIYQ